MREFFYYCLDLSYELIWLSYVKSFFFLDSSNCYYCCFLIVDQTRLDTRGCLFRTRWELVIWREGLLEIRKDGFLRWEEVISYGDSQWFYYQCCGVVVRNDCYVGDFVIDQQKLSISSLNLSFTLSNILLNPIFSLIILIFNILTLLQTYKANNNNI